MRLWKQVARWVDPAATEPGPGFSLAQDPNAGPHHLENAIDRLKQAGTEAKALESRVGRWLQRGTETAGPGPGPPGDVGDLSTRLDENLSRLRQLFRAPDNADLIIRRILIGLHPPVPAAIVFMEGLADKQVIDAAILEPLMLLSHLDHHLRSPGQEPPDPEVTGAAGNSGAADQRTDFILQRLLPGNQAEAKPDLKGITEGILYGDTAVFIEGEARAIVVETKGFPVRSISPPRQELAIRGPMDAFVEAFRLNVALVRKRLKDPRLVTEMFRVGDISQTFVAMMYLKDVVNPRLVAEVKRRVEGLKVDFVPDSSILEQLVEDAPNSLFPQTLTTERPDRVAAYLAEGHVALLADNSPFAVVLPITLWSLMQTSEDYYLRAPFGTFLRWVRLTATVLVTLAGALYLAVVNFHPEMIPTELMLSIAASREQVPFPALLELLFMEFTFELLREAGVRVPSVIGPIIGIVGALILGEAAVAARLISPIVVIIFAISGLASFAVPSYPLSFTVRILRFLFIGAAAILGIYGVALGLFILGVHLAGLRSFGVPYLSPVAPPRPNSGDLLRRPPIFQLEVRPDHLHPVDHRRQGEPARRWARTPPSPSDSRGG